MKKTTDRISSNGEHKAAERACKVPDRNSALGNSRNDPPTVSPTIPWTNLPASQSSCSNEQPMVNTAVDQDHHGDNVRESGEEDKEMLPSQPAHLSTPLRKIPTFEDEAQSGQKTSLQEHKLT